jgi:hypothetical protein
LEDDSVAAADEPADNPEEGESPAGETENEEKA